MCRPTRTMEVGIMILLVLALLLCAGIIVPAVLISVVYRESFLADALRAAQRLLQGQ